MATPKGKIDFDFATLDAITSRDELTNLLSSENSFIKKELTQAFDEKNGDPELELVLGRWVIGDAIYDALILKPAVADDTLHQVATLERMRRDLAKILIRAALFEADGNQRALLPLLNESLTATLKLPTLAQWPKSELAKALAGEDLRTRLQEIAAGLRDRTKLQIQDLSPQLLRFVGDPPSNQLEDSDMPRQSNDRDRDEYGRFVSDDDRGGRRTSSSRDDQRRASSRDDDDDRRRSRARDDDDDRRGWYGDSEGHSEAARRGWEDRDRGSSRSMRSDYRDDDRRYGRRDDDDRRYGRSGQDDDNDRGQGGWFGDSEGHSEASRRGWENREGGGRSSSRYEDDDRRYSSRSRDEEGRFSSGGGRSSRYDDNDRSSNYRPRDEEGRFTSSSRGGSRYEDEDRRRYRADYDDDDRGRRGNPGWSGDPEGHAEAARKGWEHRR